MKNFLENLIKRTGNQLKDHFQKDQRLLGLRRTDKEAVIRYDKLSDKFIGSQIRKKYPTHSILSEEGGLKKGNSNYLWIVDSLDGTKNFANWNPFFSVCIALMEGNELILGTVYAPIIDEFYIGEKGKGTFLNGKRIKVSKISELKKSYLVYCEGGEKKRQRFAKILNKIYPKVTDVRKIGSAGLETAWVAAGRVEAYFTTKIEPWDVAAGILLAQEAGGSISDFKENPWQVKTSDLLVSNGKVHSRILDLISKL